MENQYNYYTTDQNMNTGNMAAVGTGKKNRRKKEEKAQRDGQRWSVQDWYLEWLQVLHFRRVILWQEKFLVQHRQRIKTAKTTTTSNAKTDNFNQQLNRNRKCNRGN